MSGERFTIQVDAIGNFSSLMGEVGKFRSQLQNLKLPDKITNKLEKGFDNVESKVSHFQSLLNKGITTKGDFSKLVTSARAADKAIADLKEDVRSIGDKDLHIAVANSAEIQKAEQALNKLINSGEKLKNFGTTKGTGLISESEISKMQKLANTSDGLKKKFQDVTDSFKTGNIEQASAAIEKLIAHVQRYQSQMNNSKANPGKGDAMLAWANGVKEALSTMVAEVDRAKASFNQLQSNKLDQMKSSINGISTGLSTATNGVRQFINAETEAAARTNQLNEQVGHLRTQANYFFGLQNMGRLIARGIREAAESVRDLDKAMTETAVVTDFSVADMWKMLPEYTELANKLGATTQGAYETMTLYFQQGLNKEQTFEIGEETMKMARIAGLDYAQTTNMMTAALRGFNMELNQTSAQRVNDVYSKLAAITASDTRELGLAMERTASIAHSAGMDFGNTTAFLAQMIETTREAPENLGTAMKTIIARFQELKQNPYEISEVEGEEVDFNRIDKALKTIGVDLMDNRDKFRDLDDVFMDISQKWDGLSQTTQRYIATMAAGSRQQSRFLAMVQNYDRLKELTEAAANSEGAAEVQFSKTLESYEAKVNKLKNAWQQYTMELANNQAVKKAIDWLKDLVTFGNKIVKTFGKIGSIFGDVGQGLGEMAASFGLGALGFKGLRGGANLGLKLLGGMTVKGATAEGGMFTSGGRGTAGLASKIANPIVSAINRLTAIVSGEATKTAGYQNAQLRNNFVKERQQNLYNRIREKNTAKEGGGYKAFSANSVRKEFSGLSADEQKQVYKSVPALRKALQNGYAQAYKGLKLGDVGEKALTKHFKQIDNAVKSGRISADNAFRHLYNPASVAKAIDNPEVSKALNQAVEDQMKSWDTQKHAKISQRLKNVADKRGLEGEERQQFYKNQKRLIAGQELSVGAESTAQLGKVSGAMAAISSKATTAGQSVMGLGMALDSIGMHGAGAALMTVGNGIVGIGMAAEGAATGVKKLGTAFNFIKAHPIILAFTALASGIGYISIAHKKMVKDAKEAGEKVVNTYKETTEKSQKELDKISEYEESWGKWAQNVDEYGNNVGLSTGEYEDYLKAVKEITKAHPELIKGYNALGNAIVDNNTVLAEAKRLAKQEADSAKEIYLDSYSQIIKAQKANEKWQKATTGGGPEGILWGKAATPTYNAQAQDALDALRKISGADEILKNYGVTWNKAGDITENGIEILRTKGNDILDTIKDTADTSDETVDKMVTNANDRLATFGETITNLESASKDTYDWAWEYVTDKGYNQIDSGLIAPFQTAVERLAEKGLSEGEMKQGLEDLGKTFQDVGGHAQEFREVQEEVNEAQKQFGKDLDTDAYTNTVTKATKDLDNWIKELKNNGDEASKILAEYLTNYKRTVLNVSESLPTLEETFDTQSSATQASRSVYENWQKQNEEGDYYTAADNFHKMYEEVNDDIDNLGRGSKQWKTAMQAMLGNDFVFNAKSKKQIEDQAEVVNSFFKEGKEGAQNFMRYISSDKIQGTLLDPAFFEKGKTIGDYIVKDAQGNLNFDELMKLTPEQMNSLANSGGMAGEAWTAAFDKARQYYGIETSDIEQMSAVIAASTSTLRGVGDAEGKRYMRLSEFQQAGVNAGADYDTINEAQKSLEKTGTVFVDKLDKSNFSKYMKDWGISNGTIKLDGKTLNTTNAYDAMASLNQIGYNRDEIMSALASNKDLISDYENADLNQMYSDLKAAEDPTYNSVTGIQSTTESILGTLNSIALSMGILTKSDSQTIDNAVDRANNFDKSAGDFNKYSDYKTEHDQLKNDLQATYDYLVEGAEKHGNTEYGDQLRDKAEEVKEALDTLGDGLSRQEFKELQGTESYANTLQGLVNQESGILDVSKLLKIDPTTLSEKGQELQQQLTEAFNLANTGPGGLTQAALDIGTITTELSQAGEAGATAALEIKSAFIDANANGISQMDGSQLASLLNQLGVTKKELQEISQENPEINFDANVEEVDGKWQEKKKDIENNPIEAPITLGSGKNKTGTSPASFLPDKEQLNSAFSELQSYLQDFKTKTQSNKPEVNLETEKAGSKLQTLSQKLEAFKKSATTKASVGLDISGDKKLSKAAKSFKALSGKNAKASIGLDSGQVSSGIGAASKLLSSFGRKKAKASVGITDNATGKLSTISSALNRISGRSVSASVNISPNYTGTWKKTVYVDEVKRHTGGLITTSGPTYRAKGGTIAIPRFKKKGTDTIPAMLTPGEYVQNRSAVNYFGIDFMRKINHKDLSGALKSFGSAAKGNRKGTLGPNGRGGLTLTGETGFEVAWIPSENRSMILGANGPQMVDLPGDAIIWSHEQSKKILKNNSINAGSYGIRGTATNDWDAPKKSVPPTKGSKPSKDNKDTANNNKDTANNNKDTKKVIKKAGRVYVWWENQARKIEGTQRKVDQLLKKFEKELKEVGKTADDIKSTTTSYQKQLKESIRLNKQSEKQAKKELSNLAGKKSNYSISYQKTVKKNGKTKKETVNGKVNLAGYIKWDAAHGTYIIDQNAIDRAALGYRDKKRKWHAGNKSRAEAIKKLAEEKINDKLSKRNTAQDNIAKAQDALEKLSNDIYENFYRWEKSITQIYVLTQKLETISKKISIAGAQADLQFAKLEAGIGSFSDSLPKIQQALQNERTQLLQQATGKKDVFDESLQEFKDSLDFIAYAKKYLNSSNSTEARDDYRAASRAFELLNELQMDSNNFDYDKAIQGLNDKQYNEETNNRIKAVLDKIFEKQNNLLDAEEDAYKVQAEIYEKMEDYQSFISDFEQDLISGVDELKEDEINKLEKINSSLSQAYKDLIDEVKRKLDERRKQEDNAKTESDISKKQQRLAALRADTSGGHQVEIAQLEKEIADAQRDYQRSLEDQLLDRLQQQGDEAEKQRQRQIDLLEAAKEIAQQTGTNLEEVKKWLENPEANIDKIREAWLAQQGYNEATPNQQKQLEEQFNVEWSKYTTYFAELPEYQKAATDSLLSLEESVDSIAKQMPSLNKNQRSTAWMKANGFTAGQLRKLEYKAQSLSDAGYTNKQIHDAGYTIKQFKAVKGNGNIKTAIAAGYTPKQAAGEYGATAAMTIANMSGAATQKATGKSAKTLQKIVNKSKTDKAVQKDMAGVQVGKVDVNGKTKGGIVKDSHLSAGGGWVGANSGSTLYIKDWDEKTGKVKSGAWGKIPISKLTTTHLKNYPIDAKQALIYAIQHTKVGSKINKNFKSLVTAAGIVGKYYKLNNNIYGSIGSDGRIYYNDGKKGVQIWNAASGKTVLDKYKKASFIKKAKYKNVGREYASVLKANGVKGYSTGGIADYTGPAWLHGTPSKPELVLNATDTKNFLALKDVLSKAMTSTSSIENSYGGDTNFEVNINVDHLNNDYDVDRVADRVRKIIVKDAGYRNVTQVRNFR